ncbi:TetR/AcrR family transcriptional regulator [Parasphingorhabdus sp.]|uniref:TetR/AcrR family transcriptional regulator n=1 Tax=Parasphingorhabdus sp. TaxID=2709688 RepID=UPI003A9265C3
MTSFTTTNGKLLDGAMQQFNRHGFAKTSMSDIAAAAGISRTSLYKHFSTKEEVFKGLSERINGRVYDAVVEAFSEQGAWDARLLRAINARVSWVYQLLHDSEYGRELIDEKNRICGGEILAANDRFQSLVAGLIGEQVHDRGRADLLAGLLIQSVNGVLEKAETSREAQANVTLLVEVFCRGLMTG